MKTILVPTDFSANATNAVNFAIMLAKKQKAKLILLHAFQMPITAAPIPYDLLKLEKAEIEQEAKQKLQALCTQIEKSGDISYEYILAEGNPIDIILKSTKEKEIAMIIMGTKGITGLAEVIFGSTTTKVIEKAQCPVMAIPENASFNNMIKKMTYATDYRQSDIDAIKKIIEIASPFHAQLNILHISNEEIKEEEENKLMKNFMNIINTEVSYNNLSFQILRGQDVEEELEQYIADNNTDIFIMATHFRNFIDRIFGISTTKEIALNTSIPLIAFHYNKKNDVKILAES